MSSPNKAVKIKKHVDLLLDDYEWFLRTHELDSDVSSAYRTGLSGLLSMLLHSYRTVCENPAEYAAKMVSIAQVDITKKGAELVKEEFAEREDFDRSLRERSNSK